MTKKYTRYIVQVLLPGALQDVSGIICIKPKTAQIYCLLLLFKL